MTGITNSIQTRYYIHNVECTYSFMYQYVNPSVDKFSDNLIPQSHIAFFVMHNI